jgi:DNA repair protein RadC
MKTLYNKMKESATAYPKRGERTKICSSFDLWTHISKEMQELNKEVVLYVILDSKNQVVKTVLHRIGTEASCLVDVREIYKDLLFEDRSRFIMCHNHPTGDTNPSSEDKKMCEQIVKGCKTLNLLMLDFVIFGDDTFSFYDRGLLFHEDMENG